MHDPVADLSRFCCQNSACGDFGVRKTGRITVHSRQARNPILRCRLCGKTFASTRGTVYFRSKKPKDEVDAIINHVADGNGIRQTSRLLMVSKNTVMDYAHKAGEHARALHDELVRDVDQGEVQLDEKWSFVKKSKDT